MHDQCGAVGNQLGVGRQDQVGSVDVLASGAACNVNLNLDRNVSCISGEADGHGFLVDNNGRSRLAHDDNGNVNVNLLALLDGQQVDVLNDLQYGVLLDILHQGEVLNAINRDGQQCVGAADGADGFALRQDDVQGATPWP